VETLGPVGRRRTKGKGNENDTYSKQSAAGDCQQSEKRPLRRRTGRAVDGGERKGEKDRSPAMGEGTGSFHIDTMGSEKASRRSEGIVDRRDGAGYRGL